MWRRPGTCMMMHFVTRADVNCDHTADAVAGRTVCGSAGSGARAGRLGGGSDVGLGLRRVRAVRQQCSRAAAGCLWHGSRFSLFPLWLQRCCRLATSAGRLAACNTTVQGQLQLSRSKRRFTRHCTRCSAAPDMVLRIHIAHPLSWAVHPRPGATSEAHLAQVRGCPAMTAPQSAAAARSMLQTACHTRQTH